MGSSYEVKCPNCGYSTRSSCGLDHGMRAVVQTHVCLGCHELVDVLVGEFGKVLDPKRLSAKQKKKYYLCPICGGREIKVWDPDERPCSKCGTKLSKPEEPAGLWD